jgi:hypothetical protein
MVDCTGNREIRASSVNDAGRHKAHTADALPRTQLLACSRINQQASACQCQLKIPHFVAVLR